MNLTEVRASSVDIVGQGVPAEGTMQSPVGGACLTALRWVPDLSQQVTYGLEEALWRHRVALPYN